MSTLYAFGEQGVMQLSFVVENLTGVVFIP